MGGGGGGKVFARFCRGFERPRLLHEFEGNLIGDDFARTWELRDEISHCAGKILKRRQQVNRMLLAPFLRVVSPKIGLERTQGGEDEANADRSNWRSKSIIEKRQRVLQARVRLRTRQAVPQFRNLAPRLPMKVARNFFIVWSCLLRRYGNPLVVQSKSE